MRTVAVVVSLIATCTVLAACGDSGSSTSSTTATATVPTGTLGDALQNCAGPRLSGAAGTALKVIDIDCSTATSLATTLFKTGTVSGWKCTPRIAGRFVSNACKNESHDTQWFSVSWNVQ